jgi:hypothetical protein
MINQLDSAGGNCGVSVSTLYERIGSMAADGQPPSIGFSPRVYGTCGGPNAPGTLAARNARPEAGTTDCEYYSELHRIRTDKRSAAAMRMKSAKGFTGPTEAAHASNWRASEDRLPRRHRPPLRPDLVKRLHWRGRDNRIRTKIDKPSRGWIDRPGARRVRSRPPPVLERAPGRSRQSRRLTGHEDHRQDIGGLYGYVRPRERCERICSRFVTGRSPATGDRCSVAYGAFQSKW